MSSERFDIFSEAFRNNPHPILKAMREAGPAVPFSDRVHYFVGNYDHCDEILRDNTNFGRDLRPIMTDEELAALPAIPETLQPVFAAQSDWLVFNDPPRHTRIRALVQKAFTPRMVHGLRDMIYLNANRLIDAMLTNDSVDFIEEFALPLPVIVIATMLGIPTNDHLKIRDMTQDIFGTTDFRQVPSESLDKVVWSHHTFGAYIRTLIAKKRAHPDEHLLSALISVSNEGERLSEDELVALAFLLLIGGFETTTNLIGNGLMLMLTHPTQWEKVKSNPELIPLAVQEILRFEPPFYATARNVFRDLDFHGVPFKRLSNIGILLAAANRDPSKFTNPDTFDVTRDEAKPLSFGSGIHYCLGSPLAKLEAEIAFELIIQRMPDVKLIADDFKWRELFVLRGLESLPILTH